MLLAIDQGNTHTSFGIFDRGQWVQHFRLQTQGGRTPDEYAAFLQPLLKWHALEERPWEGVVVASVVPAAEAALAEFSTHYLRMTPHWVTASGPLNFKLGVRIPGEVGADRLANAAFAAEHLKLPALIVDMGTATTFDVISQDAVYQGGVIFPGVRLWVEALSRNTAKLNAIDLAFPPSVIGKDTVQCMQAGILYGYTDALNGLIARTRKEIGPCEVVFTGGFSTLFEGRIEGSTRFLPNLTLDGIRTLYRVYQESAAKPVTLA